METAKNFPLISSMICRHIFMCLRLVRMLAAMLSEISGYEDNSVFLCVCVLLSKTVLKE